MFANCRALGDVPQTIEIDVGAAAYRDKRLIRNIIVSRVFLGCGDCQAAGRLNDRACVLKNVANRGTDLIGVYRDDLVDIGLAQSKGLIANTPYGDPVRASASSSRRIR